MSGLDPEESLEEITREALSDLSSCGSSEALAVADCLNTIAQNGDEQAETDYLVGCAEEIAGWALDFIQRVKGAPSDDCDKTLIKFLLYAREARQQRSHEEVQVRFVANDVKSSFDVTTNEAAEFLSNNKRKIEDRLTELGNEVIDTFGHMASLKRLDEEEES